jgi:hypothetical protein
VLVKRTNTETNLRPWQPQSHLLRVPLHTTPEGDEIRGSFKVPRRLAGSKQHTNERHEFENIVNAALAKWQRYETLHGYTLLTKPRVIGPFDPPTAAAGDEPESEDYVIYKVTAQWVLTHPQYMGIEDFLAQRDDAARYGVSIDKGRRAQNDLPTPVKESEGDGGEDPMRAAEIRRQALGLERELIIKDGVVTGAKLNAQDLNPDEDRDL